VCLESVIDAVGHGLWISTAEGVVVNAAARRLLAIPDSAVPPPLEAFRPRRLDGSPLAPEEREPYGSGAHLDEIPFRYRIARLDGVERVFDGTTEPLRGPGGEVVGWVAVFCDVTEEHKGPLAAVELVTDLSERRRFERELVQSGKLATLGELAAGVAHEVNNPLFAILALVEFLLNEEEPGTKRYERLELIQRTGLEIREIVRALIDFAREPTDEQSRVALEEVAAQTVALVRRTSAAKSVELIELYPDAPLVVHASPNQLKQVFLNLIGNAQQAMPDGGTVSIEVVRDEDWAVARVVDTGPGIAPEVLPRVFEPFFTTKRAIGGTGLGLPVSLGIAQMHGGDLTLDSSPGDGAVLTLRLPLAS
jgi:signal transduction histidine kinase